MPDKKKPTTRAGTAYIQQLTDWLQDTRLLSEGAFRLYQDFQRNRGIDFSEGSWPKPKGKQRDETPTRPFVMDPASLARRMSALLRMAWSERFVFLETLWEEYLEELVKELRHNDAKLFEPFVETDFMAGIVKDVLTDRLVTADEIKDEVAIRFAAGITRRPWKDQWKQLKRLNIGIGDGIEAPWFRALETYCEMRNCIVHRGGSISDALRRMGDRVFSDPANLTVDIWPTHLDFYRHQFIACLLHMETCIGSKFRSTNGGPGETAPAASETK